jgi:hypothetical protein
MQHDSKFAVRYVTSDPVPIRDIIQSLQGVETILEEMAHVLPKLVDGLQVQSIEVRVREIAQESPLRELFLVSLFLAFQQDLEDEIVTNVESLTGYRLPNNIDTMVTVLAMVLLFYGVGAIKDFVVGKYAPGPSQRMLTGLIGELAHDTGKSPEHIRETLDERYGDKTLWKRITDATSGFFGPSKRQDSAPIEINDRNIDRETVQDVPAQYLLEHETDVKLARPFENVVLELHAKDRDHSGKGWAAIPHGISDQRLKLKLMEDVSAADLWGRDTVRGDIIVVYEKVGAEMIPKAVHLYKVLGDG